MRTTTLSFKEQTPETLLYEKIAQDMKQVLLLLLSERGHGKSSSLKTIIQYIKEHHPEIEYKVFDTSLSWYSCAPMSKRQYVTVKSIRRGLHQNTNDCVYELGELPLDHRRMFIATCMSQDMRLARENIKNGLPNRWTIYIIEEANTLFNSYSFRKNDEASMVLNDFVSVGRNFGLGAILISTAEIGELSPSIRRRRRILYGRISSPSDIAEAKRQSKTLAEQVKTQPKYTFTYQNISAKIPDKVHNTPVDHKNTNQPTQSANTPRFDLKWWISFFTPITLVFLFFQYIRGI